MESIFSFLHSALLVVGVILLFNLMIFVHELGHFFAARWRGLYVDRFQIWFGKPLWKKTIGGVQWGLGWIPAGGFVSLPQMAPMESIEGESDLPKDLPAISAWDKIWVAFAGPFFSFLLALAFACVVWVVGKPTVDMSSTVVGYIDPTSPALKAGLALGDKIVAVDGHPVTKWVGDMEGVRERIMLGENKTVQFTVERLGVEKPLIIESEYIIPETSWWQRRAMRQVGFSFAQPSVVEQVLPGSPAQKAGLSVGDEVVSYQGQKVWSPLCLMEESIKGAPMSLEVKKKETGELATLQITPQLPLNAAEMKEPIPLLGVIWSAGAGVEAGRVHPTPWEQVSSSLRWMKLTLEKIAAPDSDVGMQHLSGPVGILNQFYTLMSSPDGWALALWFAVVLNINLAILNLLPLPVVDGGHIILGFAELVRGKPVSGRPLEWVQTGFVFVILFFFVFVSFKDVGDLFGKEEKIEAPRFQ